MSPFRTIWLPAVLAAGFILAAHAPARAAAPVPTSTITPAATKVLILPALDESGDLSPAMASAHVAVANHRAEYEFLTRGFTVIGPTDAANEAQKEGIDLTDVDARTRQALASMGRALGATWVVDVDVIDVREAAVHNDFTSAWLLLGPHQRRAEAKVRIRVVDVSSGEYLFNGYHRDNKTTNRVGEGSIFGIWLIGTTGLFNQALDTTIQRGFEPVVSPYPQIRAINDQFGEDDLVSRVDSSNSATPSPLAGRAGEGSNSARPAARPVNSSSPSTAPIAQSIDPSSGE
ncbi:MAG: hypothetical protein ACLQVD_19750 [Capsulimonadaceae bacterium]